MSAGDEHTGEPQGRRLEWSVASAEPGEPYRGDTHDVALNPPPPLPVTAGSGSGGEPVVPGAGSAVRRPGRVRRVVGFGVVSVLVLVGVPVVWLGWNLVRETVEAGKGGENPGVAVLTYFLETPLGGPWAGDEVDYNVYGCGNDENLHGQAVASVAAAKRAEVPQRWQFDRVELDSSPRGINIEREEVNGNRATVLTYARWSYSNVDPGRRAGEPMGWSSTVQPWQFELERDSQGWRVCGVIAPDPCAPESQLRCDPQPGTGGPSTGPSPSPSSSSPSPAAPKVWDSRVGWRCLPDTPEHFRRSDCVSPPPGWSPPGPHVCAPDYPLIRGQDTVQMCRRLGWEVS